MTHVEYKYGDELRLISKDHANSAIVCAGISAITQALAGWCENFAPKCKTFVYDGLVEITITNPTPESRAAFDMAVIGLKQIEAGYPEHIEVHAG